MGYWNNVQSNVDPQVTNFAREAYVLFKQNRTYWTRKDCKNTLHARQYKWDIIMGSVMLST